MPKYEPKACFICGKMFTPMRKNAICCSPECRAERELRRKREWNRNHKEYFESYRRTEHTSHHATLQKEDTIVAIGYAERQIAKSLERAGRINTEL